MAWNIRRKADAQEAGEAAEAKDGQALGQGEAVSDEGPLDDQPLDAQTRASKKADKAKKPGTAKRAAGTVGGAAKGAADAVATGFTAMRDVRAASREHASARAQMKAMREALDADTATLEHRDQVTRDYARIVAEQGRLASAASWQMREADAEIARLSQERSAFESQLAAAKAEDDQSLRPYRQIAEAAKGRLDDATRTVAEVKRALKVAEGQVREATDRRDQATTAANRSVDASNERLRKVQEELRHLQADPSAAANAVRNMQAELETEQAHAASARAEADASMKAAQTSLENAQTHLWTQRQSLEDAQRSADTAKRDYSQRKAEYDRLAETANARQHAIAEQIAKRKEEIEQQRTAHDAAADRYDAAQALVDEAEDIHANTEETERLRSSVARQTADLADQQSQIQELAHHEKSLRARTRGSRAAFVVVAAVAVVVVVALVLWLTVLS